MMKPKVFFSDMRTSLNRNMGKKIRRLLQKARINSVISRTDLVAVKMHFGEQGNTAFIRPILIRTIIDEIYACGGKPFLTDTNTLYRGERSEAVAHLNVALRHGFNFTVVAAPVLIADGLRGSDATKVPINGKHFTEVLIGTGVVQADSLVSVAHFKGHELTGFGGTLKNLGMGCASREGKLKQHSTIAPEIKPSACRACGRCADWCPVGAIRSVEKKFTITAETCIGCAECITVCPHGAVEIKWNEAIEVFQEKMIESALGALQDKHGRSLFLNFLTDISPACDCYGHADRPIVPDVGILASDDPVAIDQASVDLVNAQQGYADSALKAHYAPGQDKFKGIYPDVAWEPQLQYAQALGLGTRNYELVRV